MCDQQHMDRGPQISGLISYKTTNGSRAGRWAGRLMRLSSRVCLVSPASMATNDQAQSSGTLHLVAQHHGTPESPSDRPKEIILSAQLPGMLLDGRLTRNLRWPF